MSTLRASATMLIASAITVGVAGAQVTSPKIIVSNAGTEIPLLATSVVQVLSNGDLSVQCRLNAQNQCPGLGSGSGGSTGATPPTLTLTPSAATSVVGGSNNVTLGWSSNGDACYAIGPTSVSNWNGRVLGPTGSQPLSITTAGDYTFALRCYSPGGSREVSTATITVTAPVAPVLGDYCGEYYSPTGAFPVPTSPNFNAFGNERVEDTFFNIFGVEPGNTTNRPTVPGLFLDPVMKDGRARYMSISFEMLAGKHPGLSLSWGQTQAANTPTGAVIVTISPCPGDFRPPDDSSPDRYLHQNCRFSTINNTGALAIGVAGSGTHANGCVVPADKRLYINIANSFMYGTSAPTQSTCGTSAHCGVAISGGG